MEVSLMGGRKAKGAPYVKVPIQICWNKRFYCFIWSIPAPSFPSKDFTKRTCNFVKHFNVIKASGIALKHDMKVDNFERIEELNDLKANFFEMNAFNYTCRRKGTRKTIRTIRKTNSPKWTWIFNPPINFKHENTIGTVLWQFKIKW